GAGDGPRTRRRSAPDRLLALPALLPTARLGHVKAPAQPALCCVVTRSRKRSSDDATQGRGARRGLRPRRSFDPGERPEAHLLLAEIRLPHLLVLAQLAGWAFEDDPAGLQHVAAVRHLE